MDKAVDPRPRHSPWTTRDAMILVAATALGLGIMMTFDPGPGAVLLETGVHLATYAMYAHPLVLAWAVALVVIGRFHRREPRRKFLRRPGHLACVLGLAAYAIETLVDKAEDLVVGRGAFWEEPFIGFLPETFIASGLFVLVGWITLLATGSWRPVPDWTDRLGRLLGAGWIAGMILDRLSV